METNRLHQFFISEPVQGDSGEEKSLNRKKPTAEPEPGGAAICLGRFGLHVQGSPTEKVGNGIS